MSPVCAVTFHMPPLYPVLAHFYHNLIDLVLNSRQKLGTMCFLFSLWLCNQNRFHSINTSVSVARWILWNCLLHLLFRMLCSVCGFRYSWHYDFVSSDVSNDKTADTYKMINWICVALQMQRDAIPIEDFLKAIQCCLGLFALLLFFLLCFWESLIKNRQKSQWRCALALLGIVLLTIRMRWISGNRNRSSFIPNWLCPFLGDFHSIYWYHVTSFAIDHCFILVTFAANSHYAMQC